MHLLQLLTLGADMVLISKSLPNQYNFALLAIRSYFTSLLVIRSYFTSTSLTTIHSMLLLQLYVSHLLHYSILSSSFDNIVEHFLNINGNLSQALGGIFATSLAIGFGVTCRAPSSA